MARADKLSLYLWVWVCLLPIGPTGIQAQGTAYEVIGPQQIFTLCNSYHYTIETSAQLDTTEWFLVNSSGTTIPVFGGVYSADIQFFAPDIYTLYVKSLTVNGGTLSDSIKIFVTGTVFQPEIIGCYIQSPDANCFQVCAHSTLTLQGELQGNQWTVTGADSYVSDYDTYITITWGAGGTGEVIVYSGCPFRVCFEIIPEPTADFITDPPAIHDTLTVCQSQEIQFENHSFNGLSYQWHFGDGAESDQYDATHTFSSPGYYTVSLETKSICSCTAQKQIVVHVLPAPVPTLDCVNSVCPETRQHYTASTDGCTQFNWSVSSNGTIVDGGQPGDNFIEIIWHSGPEGTVDLAVGNCNSSYCSYTNTFHVPIISPDGPISGDQSVCADERTIYKAPYFPGTQYHWLVGPNGKIVGPDNSNTITVHWEDVNSVTTSFVEVKYDDCFLKCGGNAHLDVSITPEIKLAGDVQICQGASASVHATAGFITPLPVNVAWHIEDESGNTVYTQPGLSDVFTYSFPSLTGIYQWVAVNTSPAYCTEVARLKIYVAAVPATPTGIIGDSVICPGQTYGFTIDPTGPFTTHWMITDGLATFTSQGQSLDYTFGATPPFQIEAYNSDLQYPSCVSGGAAILLHTPADSGIEGPDDGCFNGLDEFSFPLISGADYHWEVVPSSSGEVRRSDLNAVQIFWTQSGPATIRLTVCGTVIDKPVTIHPLPVFSIIGPPAACPGELITYQSDQPAMIHTWVDQNENELGHADTIAIYPGTYALELQDQFGCTDRKSFSIGSYPVPVVNLTTSDETFYCGAIPAGVTVTANTDGGGYIYEWFKDDISQGFGGPVFNITDFAMYDVEVTNSYGCKAKSPKVNFSACCPVTDCNGPGGGPPGCSYIPFDFSILKTSTACNIHDYFPQVPGIEPNSSRWVVKSISEGIIAVADQDLFSYTFNLPGYYKIELLSKLTGFPYGPACGHGQVFADTIRAVADFNFTGSCAGTSVMFEDLTTMLPGETIVSWRWDFGDPASGGNNTSTLQDPSHLFAASGDYLVQFKVNLASGCFSTKQLTVHISDGPVLNPIYDASYCEGEAQTFSLAASVYDVIWNFGDPSSGLQNTASSDTAYHTFNVPGLYTITVTGKDIYGCPGQAVLMSNIQTNTLTGTIDVQPTGILCYGDTARLTAPSGGVAWIWSNDGTTAQTVVGTTGSYSVLMQDQYHCSYAPPPVYVSILPKPTITVVAREIIGVNEYGPWQNPLVICEGTEFQIQVFGAGNLTYHWSDGSSGNILTFTSEGGNLPMEGHYTFEVYGDLLPYPCLSDTASAVIDIIGLPDVPLIALTGGSGCALDDNTLQVTNPQAGIEYQWSDGQVGTSIITRVAGTYLVIAMNTNGCTRQSATIEIKASAPVDLIPGGCFIECDPLTVCLPLLSDVSSYTLFQNGVPVQSGTTWPSDFTVTQDGSYYFEVINSAGCKVTSDPLNLELYPGIGSITVITYLDSDGNGMISGGDTQLPGIPVQIESASGATQGSTFTGMTGDFVFENYPLDTYTASFDLTLLSSQYKILIDSVSTSIATCDDSVVVALLLTNNCSVSGPDQLLHLCPGDMVSIGDSVWTDTGTYIMHLPSTDGCDSVFQVNILLPDSIVIGATVWVDVDQNGILSPADTTIQGITIMVDQLINSAPFYLVTGVNGSVSGIYPSGQFLVSVDSAGLPGELNVIYGAEYVPDTICGLADINFLLVASCVSVIQVQQDTICPGDSVLVQGQWLDAGGVYSFVLSDPASFCDTTLDVQVSVSNPITVQADVDWNCNQLGHILLHVMGDSPLTYDWSSGGNADTLLTGLQDGMYAVLITDANGCSVEDTFTITSPAPLDFQVGGPYTVHEGDSVIVDITGDILTPGLTYDWQPGNIVSCPTCSSAWAFPLQDTIIRIHITDADSCTYDLVTAVQVTHDTIIQDEVYVPNVFSPNGDGVNDRWILSSKLAGTYVHVLRLWDYWGELIFEKNEFYLYAFDGWDGTFRHRLMNPGVFVYTAEVTLGDGRNVYLKGDVTLVR